VARQLFAVTVFLAGSVLTVTKSPALIDMNNRAMDGAKFSV
jgi:hypothetical protein